MCNTSNSELGTFHASCNHCIPVLVWFTTDSTDDAGYFDNVRSLELGSKSFTLTTEIAINIIQESIYISYFRTPWCQSKCSELTVTVYGALSSYHLDALLMYIHKNKVCLFLFAKHTTPTLWQASETPIVFKICIKHNALISNCSIGILVLFSIYWWIDMSESQFPF